MSKVVDGAPYQARIVNHVNHSTGQIRCIEWRILYTSVRLKSVPHSCMI
jgi:hypothetical protein